MFYSYLTLGTLTPKVNPRTNTLPYSQLHSLTPHILPRHTSLMPITLTHSLTKHKAHAHTALSPTSSSLPLSTHTSLLLTRAHSQQHTYHNPTSPANSRNTPSHLTSSLIHHSPKTLQGNQTTTPSPHRLGLQATQRKHISSSICSVERLPRRYVGIQA